MATATNKADGAQTSDLLLRTVAIGFFMETLEILRNDWTCRETNCQ